MEPQIIDLETAVDHIKQACDERDGTRSPFFFMVGAGLSYPSVPLASEIIEECKEIAKKYNRNSEPAGGLLIDEYAHWLQQTFPQSMQRQRYLRKLIEHKSISPANFRLAHLLLDKKITNLVVTTNFDDFLSRALTLFGKPHIVCDHPLTVNRIDPEQDDLQIIHVHGTYWFYDCCNLRGEIEVRAQASPHTTQTMASLLDRILSSHSPLVIGYCGWEDDVFMTALKRRLQSPLPYNLYWFCYRQSDIDALPEELKFNPQVYFVVPPPPPPDPDASDIAYQGEEMQKFAPETMQAQPLLDKDKEPLTLSAKDVLDRLIQTFELKAPELTKDPLGFFAEHLHRSLKHGSMEDDKSDIYLIGSVIDKIKRAKALEGKAVQAIEADLENIRDAVRRLEYGTVIKLASQINQSKLSVDQLGELMDSTYKATLGLSDSSNEELEGYNLVIKIGDQLIKQNISDSALLERVAKALYNKGFTLGSLNRSDEEIAVYDEVIKRFGNAKEPALLKNVATALVNKGVALGSLNRSSDAIDVFNEVVKRFGNTTDPVLLERVARALVNKGLTLGSLNRSDEEIAVYDEVVKRFGDAQEPALLEQVVIALITKVFTLDSLKRINEKIAVYDEIVNRLDNTKEPGPLRAVAWALFNKGGTLGSLNRNDEEIAVYDEVVKRFSHEKEPALLEYVARALVNKGLTLGSLNRRDDEIEVYDEVVKRFGNAKELALLEKVAMTLYNKGVALDRLKRSDDALSVYEEVVNRYGNAKEPALLKRVAMAFVNKADIFYRLNRRDDAIVAYDEVLKRFDNAKEPQLLEQVIRALVNKGVILWILERKEDSRKMFSHVMDAFSTNQELDILVGRVVALAGLARFNEAIPLLQDLTGKDKQKAKECISVLEWLSSAPQTSDGMRQFLEEARQMLETV